METCQTVISPPNPFHNELVASFSTQRGDKKSQSLELETCVSNFIHWHKQTVYPNTISNNFLNQHFAITSYNKLTGPAIPSGEWMKIVAPIIMDLQKPSNFPTIVGTYTKLLLGNNMNNLPGFDTSVFISNNISLKTTSRINHYLYLGTFLQDIPVSKVIDASSNFLPFVNTEKGLLFRKL